MRRKRKSCSLISLVLIIVGYLVILTISPLHAQLADSAWPMFQHDTRHTGQSPYVGPENNNLKWQYALPNGIINASPVIGSDGTIYIGNSGVVFAISRDGSLKWRYETHGGGIGDCAPAISLDGTIYVPSASYSFYALNPDGTLKWTYQSETNFSYSSPSIGADGIVYVGSGNDLLAIKPDGNLLWKYRVREEVASSRAIALDGTIYVRGRSDYLCAINKDGTLKWRLYLGISYHAGIGVSSPAIGTDGTIYTPGMVEGSGLYAINPDGSIKWVYLDIEVSNNNKTPAVASDGTIYIAGTGRLIAVDSDGNLKWTFDLNWFSNSSPAIDDNGTIYIGTWDHYFCAINPDGTLKWSFETLNNIDSSSAIGTDGTIYFGSWDGYLYAIGETNAPAPGIKANGSDGPLAISQGDLLTIEVSLDPSSHDGENADWWVAATSPFGLYWFTLDRGWVRSDTPVRVYGGPLFSLSPYTILKISTLPVGDYTFYFGVDNNMDGILDATYLDWVLASIQ